MTQNSEHSLISRRKFNPLPFSIGAMIVAAWVIVTAIEDDGGSIINNMRSCVYIIISVWTVYRPGFMRAITAE